MQNPKTLEDTKKVVMAGMKLLYSPQARQFLDSIIKSKGSLPEGIASNVSGLFRIIWEKSGGKIPPEAIPPAIMILVYELASFLRDAGKEIDPDEVEDAAAMAIQMTKEILKQVMKNGAAPKQPAQQPAQAAPQPPVNNQWIVGSAIAPQGV